ncbi:MAG: LysR family transcriptional regulator [Bacilli bacterium]|nr:LysR family transcriptional regulator [Bacilli bacterium]MBQ6283120.1 LysR family transcriptional regulator [Bacilli bacterium]
MNISFEYYKTFCIVAESKSITEAAEKLLISQPAITKTIKILENEIGSSLFNRSHSGIKLTTEGERLYAYVKPLMLQLDETKNVMDEIISDGKMNIRIGTSITVLRMFLIEYIKKYTKEHPNVHVYVEDNTNNNLITKIKEGAIDIAIIISSYNYVNKYSNITRYKIEDLTYGLFCSDDYMDKLDKTISVHDIKDKNFIINVNTTEINKFYQNHKLNNFLSVVSNSFIIDFVKAGVGIGMVIREFGRNIDGIHEIKVKEELPKSELVALTNNNKYHSIAISYFLNGLIKK